MSAVKCLSYNFKLNVELNAATKAAKATNVVLKHLDTKGFLSEIRLGSPDRAVVNQPIVSKKLSSDTSLQACPVGS
ncbi:MAG TPA: hypothetical protein VMW91_04155 [Desulfosporosinus sp.]|nr:hypothetical protein [Desulfosporosinus sp.]